MTQTTETIDVTNQRADLEARLADLRGMNGLPVDLVRQAQEAVEAKRVEMAEIEGQLAELDAITGARAKQQRADAERVRIQRRDALRKQLVELEERRLKAIAAAEAGAWQFAASLKEAADTAVEMRKIAVVLGSKGLTSLGEIELISRCASRLGSVICSHGGNHNIWTIGALGTFIWAGTSLFPANQNWAEAEERLFAPSIVSIIERDI
jgi:hypothetical protein